MFTLLFDGMSVVVRTTVALSLTAGLVWLLIRRFKPVSPRLQQLAWFLVLLQGIVLMRLSAQIPWYATDVKVSMPFDSARWSSLEPELKQPHEFPSRPGRSIPSVPLWFEWPFVVFCLWLTGCVTILAWWTLAYFRVAWQESRCPELKEDWDAELRQVLGQKAVTRPINLCITDDTGPILIWRRGRPEVMVPRAMWELLSSPQRMAILRHEVAHYRHGDLWNGMLFRLLALPHWFNPIAWWVIANLDECAEWMCDDEAIGPGRDCATEFAELLLWLGTNTRSVTGTATSIRGGRLHRRICRVLTHNGTDKSLMRKLLLATIPLALLTIHLVQVQLVAAPPAQAQSSITRALPPPIMNPDQPNRAYSELVSLSRIECVDVPLKDIMEYVSALHHLPIRIDEAALAVAKIRVDVPLTLSIDDVPLRRILNQLLMPLDLDWHIESSGVLVTTRIAVGRHLDDALKYEIQIIDFLCELTDTQRQKLETLGRRDFQRSLNEIEKRKANLKLSKIGEEKVAQLWLEIEKLHQEIETGPFGNESLFRKSLETVLTPAQLVKYNPVRVVLQAGGQVATVQSGPDVLLSVQLVQTPFTNDDLSSLKTLSSLGSLRLDVTKVTDAGLIHLRDLTNLRELGLFGTQITDVGLIELKGLTNLQTLVIGGTEVTDAGLANLKGLTKLQSLVLSHLNVSNVGLAHLQELTSLQWIGLNSTKIDDAGLVYLQTLTKLQRLELSDTSVTDAGLVHLKRLKTLQRLRLRNSKVTEGGIADLKLTLPNLTLEN